MIDFQTKLMGDSIRNEALYRALKKVIRKGESVVADIGSGTGFLSFLASQLGAKECFLYETSVDVLELSRKIARQNGIRNCHFFNTHSTAMRSPVRADIVISEVLGNFAYEEHLIETMNDAKRFLKPDGILIPQTLSYYAAPVAVKRYSKEVNVWDDVGYDLDFSAAQGVALNNIYVKTIRAEDLWTSKEAIQEWDKIDFREKNESVRKAALEWGVERETPCFGFALWWDCQLVPGVELSTSPKKTLTHWEQIYLPLLTPCVLKKGERMTLELTSDTRLKMGLNITWSVAVFDSADKKRHHETMDMRKGYLG